MIQQPLFAGLPGTEAWKAPVRPRRECGEPVGDPLPHASHAQDGRGRRDTSRMAYAEQRATGKVGGAQGRIVEWLRARPGQSFTRAEIGRAIGMPLSGVCGRVNELLHIKCVLVELPRRPCAVSGKQAHPVRLA